jgi:uncharacterized protein YehS (DUF1456 family)
MTNNDIIRSIRYTFNFNDTAMMNIFTLAGLTVTRAELSDWLKKDDDPEYKALHDASFSTFLNGLIIYKRGRKEGEQPIAEKKLDNNIIFRKLKIALGMKDEDILEILELSGRKISKHELSAFFRKPDQSQYRACKDQILRNFLHGLKLKFRGTDENMG